MTNPKTSHNTRGSTVIPNMEHEDEADLKVHDDTRSTSEREIILEAGRAERNYWRDLWAYRELFAILAWRDVAVRYKQSVIGVGWALIRPLLTMLIFTFIFGRVAGLPSEGTVPYPVMVYAGMLPWFLFSTIVGDSSQSLVSNSSMITKIYFPRIIIPAASSIVALVDFAVSFLLMVVLMIIFGVVPNWNVIFLPLFVVLGVLSAFAPALLLAALNIRYRDFRFIVPFIVQFGLYVSPVGFSSELIPQEWQLLYHLNPVVSVIDGFRWCLLGGDRELYLPGLALGMTVTTAIMFAGLRFFRATERTFADVA